ncbi:MAG TPA: hypothetical protein VNZ52_09280 [Candidatus Thermoplasmatota archaeon]|nr:hypothetical protein [Candidatus Thermoplasmatota archaeon]
MDPKQHKAPWGRAPRFSESGDESADGTVTPETADYVATQGNRARLTAEERAASMQRPLGEPPGHEVASEDAVPEAFDDYGLGRPGHLAPERRKDRPGSNKEESQ